jgi:tetratricopeptide (TPR) repeat protein
MTHRLWRQASPLALAAALSLWPWTACAQGTPASSGAALIALNAGRYEEAVQVAERVLAANASDGDAADVLIRALNAAGTAGAAIVRGRALGTTPIMRAALGLSLGEAFQATGKLDEAERAFRDARGGRDSLLATYRLAELAFERGDHAGAMAAFDRFIDVYNARRATLSASDLRAIGLACRMLGRTDPQLFKDALRALDESVGRDSSMMETQVDLGYLFVEKFNTPDARRTFDGVLRRNPRHVRALVGMARVLSADGNPQSGDYVRRALEVDGANAEARTLSAMQLVDGERYSDAIAEARRGLVIDSTAPGPLATLAAAYFLSGDTASFGRIMERLHARLPRAADAEVVLADVAARNRLYAAAATFALAGVARDSGSARARALAGINLMRLGRIAEGRAQLDRAFAIDPYDVWVKNTLDLLDTFKDYAEIKTARFVISAERKDAPLLELFVGPLAEEAFDSLAARYAFRPETPVRVELFRSHADFSVRTVGLAGLGALGVSFGGVIAMDSPAARRVGEFNWGSTLWHELAHTFTLGASGNRVPRWISEGLSVYEERRARPSWGSDVSPALIAAYKGGRLHPVSRLNDGFVRPRYPEEVTLSYVLASFVCEMIDREHGLNAIRRLLAAYRAGESTEQAFRGVIGLDLAAFDARFDQWFKGRFPNEFRAVNFKAGEGPETQREIEWDGPLADAMEAASGAAARRDWDASVRELERAKGMFPAFAGDGSAYHLLARVALQRGDQDRAIAELRALTERNESAFAEHVELATLLEKTGAGRDAVGVLERAVFITPFDASVHERTAEWGAAAGRHGPAIRARRALLALNPTDRVEALYQLAVVLAAAGDRDAARRELLRALDLAPNFEKGQQLLLSLRQPEGPR